MKNDQSIRDDNGRNVLNAVRWEAIDVSAVTYDPGESFYLLVGVAGNLCVVGEDMDDIAPGDVPCIPLTAGEHPLRCIKVLVNGGNTAQNVYALFTEPKSAI